MTTLDYVKVIGRLGVVYTDGAFDPDKTPDTIWCDAGEVWFTPLITVSKFVTAEPVPVSLGQSTIKATVDSEGYISLRGDRFIHLVDLTSEKLNPFINLGKATHKVEYIKLKADGDNVTFPGFNGRFAADNLDAISSAVDITLVSPVPVSGGTATIVGPRGVQGIEGPIGPIGPERFLIEVGGVYPTRLDSNPHVFIGDTNPDLIMLVGDTWITQAGSIYDESPYVLSADLSNPTSDAGSRLSAATVPRWKASTAYATGDTVMAPDGSMVKRVTAGTTDATYASANWVTVATTEGTQAKTELDALYKNVDTGWIAPTFQNSWVNFGGAEPVAQYRKIGNHVHLRGLIKTGTMGQTAFNIPVGFRPLNALSIAVFSNNAFGSVQIGSDGNVIPVNGSNASFSIDAISFLVD